MAALAYLLLPVTGAFAFLLSRSPRTRTHGLQAIVLGTLWPLALYGASALAAVLTRVVAAAGVLVWLAFLVLTALGRDPKLPFLGGRLFALSEDGPRRGPPIEHRTR
ncbi:MAG: hypothetical protein M3277_10430 [Actinomycetota bacterium]|nr:hypothetical protein [Actinomycetota bacterium]